MKYKAKTKECHLIVRAKTSWGEEIDHTALNAFMRLYLRGFLKPRLVKNNVIEYTGPVGISLYERLKMPMTKRDFLFIMEQIVVAVQKIQSNKLNMVYLVMDVRNVFINDLTKEVQFLYVPTKGGSETAGIVAFVESIVYSVRPASERDAECVTRFFHFLKAQKYFKAEAVEAFIVKEDRSVVNTIKKQNAGQSGMMTSKPKHYYDRISEQENAVEEPTGLLDQYGEEPTGLLDQYGEEPTGLLDQYGAEATGLLDQYGEEATGLLDQYGEEATGLLNQYDDEATGLLNADDEGTALLETPTGVAYPTLYRVLTDETVSVDKPVFRLGKEKSYVDYFVANNNAVSRSHADIITRGTRYFVIDLNSKNHTYINDQVIAIQCETEIRDGDRLKLGNEEFIFRAARISPNGKQCPRCGKKSGSMSNFCTYCGNMLK